jgi:hypothetical protein
MNTTITVETIKNRIKKLEKVVDLMPSCLARDEKLDELALLKKQLKARKSLKIGEISFIGLDDYNEGKKNENKK